MATKEVAKTESAYITASFDEGGPLEALFAGGNIDAFSLPSIEMNGEDWAIEKFDGRQYEDVVRGIIVHVQNTRAYFVGEDDDGPPVCASRDGVTGVGDNGQGPGSHACEECPLSVRPANAGSPCRPRAVLYLAREGMMLPLLLGLPPTSLNNWNAYRIRLFNEGLTVQQVETEFKLRVAGTGQRRYSVAELSAARTLTAEESAYVQEYVERVVSKINPA